MMAGKNQAALAVCAQTKVIFLFKLSIGDEIAYSFAVLSLLCIAISTEEHRNTEYNI